MMRDYLPLTLLILPIAYSLPSINSETTKLIDNGPVTAGLASFKELLEAFHIKDLDSLISCRKEDASCPLKKQPLINFIGELCMQHIPINFTAYAKDSMVPFSDPAMNQQSTDVSLDAVRSNLRNNLATGSMIYMLLTAYGSTLEKQDIQRFNECYTVGNETFMTNFKRLNEDIRKNMTALLDERTLLDSQFDRIVQDVHNNFTKEENQLALFATEIQRGNYLVAMTNFRQLDDWELFPAIIRRVEDEEKLLKFVNVFPQLEDRFIGYEAILNNSKINDFSVLSLNYYHKLNDLFLEHPWWFSPNRKKNNLVPIEIEMKVREKIKYIADLIVTKDPENYQKLIEYSSVHVEPFNMHLERIIEQVSFPEDLLDFAGSLTQITQSARIYIKILDKIKREGLADNLEFLKSVLLGIKIKELIQMKNYINIPENIKNQLEELKQEFPADVKNIIWGHVCIKNSKKNGYLHQNNRCDSYRGNVILSEDPDFWAIESNSKLFDFTIRHVFTKKILYTTDGSLLYTGIENSTLTNQYWNIYKLATNEFHIKNVGLNEYLSFKKSQSDFVICTDAITALNEPHPDDSDDYYERMRYISESMDWYFLDSKDCQ